MKIQLLDLVAQYRTIQAEVDTAIHEVLESGQFILGPQVAGLEKEMAAYLGVEQAVGVASGTDALILALRALDIGPGHEVIMPAYTFFATAEAVMMVGATPVFVDIEPETYGLDVAQVAKRVTERTRAVLPVHLYGHPADMGPLLELAERHSLKVIEDNAQAIGSEYQGRRTGGLGHMGCLSFFPSKNLGAYGDGGMVTTNDADLADRVRVLRAHGWRDKYLPERIGYNSRLDALQAAILRVKLRHLDEWNAGRRAMAARYNEALATLDLGLPTEASNACHVYHLYIIRVQERDRLQAKLKEAGVATAIYYPRPLHLLAPCEVLGYKAGDFPVSEKASQETLAIPIYPELSDEQFEFIVSAVKQAVS